MKLSIITPTLNSIKYLSRCYKSVFELQNYKNIEWIIVDGGSKDGTIEFLKNLNNPAIKIYSENSNHPSKAYHFGITKVSGEIIGTLGSDDYYENNIFSTIVKVFENPKINWLIGSNTIINSQGNEIRKIITRYKNYNISNYSLRKLLNNNFIPMQSVFWKKNFMPDKIGNFNTTNFIESMDYEMWIRMAINSNPTIVNKRLSYFRMHKNSITTKGNFDQMNQMLLISCKYGEFNIFKKGFLKIKITLIYIIYRILNLFY